ncbi:META domain-containing protein [Hephaestia sp. GCM10023244]|uniref:META domain-containing protein n=1 Tax=unclassified Hephaestia TaxID=2631281 RepID=UPI002076DEB4|nr:META domain-containing protein [Hephaestia sp. MAHUQ-44]MCM8731361.1 META domain-containing protein [Hephaestia sp. MAHUQ-44]
MRRSIIMLMGAAGLAGCVMDQAPAPDRPGPPPRPRPPASDSYRAIGTEPGWALTIGSRTMRYEGDYGQNVVEVPTPEPRTTTNGRRYQTRQLTVDITRTPCSDGMSDRRYPDTVRVTTRRGTVRGCGGIGNDRPDRPGPGGPGRPGAGLSGTSWTIDAIDGRQVRLDRPATVEFTREGRIQGSAGCNRFNGEYQERRDTLLTGKLAVTRMMCQGNAMTVENRFLKILDGPVTTQQRGQTLTLSSREGSVTLRKTSR